MTNGTQNPTDSMTNGTQNPTGSMTNGTQNPTGSMADAAHDTKEVVVIGAGLMRTGTHSLKVALEKLFGGPCYHMYVLFKDPEPHLNFWRSALAKDPTDEEWRAFLRGFRAAVDFPACACYKRLMEVFPDAKVVLSVRDAKAWSRSVKNTVHLRAEKREMMSAEELGPMHDFNSLMRQFRYRAFGEEVDLSNEEQMTAAFQQYNDEVRRYVPVDRLLVFEAKDGWEPLCNFLGLPVPDEPYPVTNSTDQFKELSTNEFGVPL